MFKILFAILFALPLFAQNVMHQATKEEAKAMDEYIRNYNKRIQEEKAKIREEAKRPEWLRISENLIKLELTYMSDPIGLIVEEAIRNSPRDEQVKVRAKWFKFVFGLLQSDFDTFNELKDELLQFAEDYLEDKAKEKLSALLEEHLNKLEEKIEANKKNKRSLVSIFPSAKFIKKSSEVKKERDEEPNLKPERETQTLTEGDVRPAPISKKGKKYYTAYSVLKQLNLGDCQALGIEYSDGYFWISDDKGYKIRKLDILNNRWIEDFDQIYINPGVRSAHGIACDGRGNLYYNISYGGQIIKVDVSNHKPLTSRKSPITWTHGIDYGEGSLWLHEHDGDHGNYNIYRCDPDEPDKNYFRFTVPHNSSGGHGITLAEKGYMWYCNGRTKRYYKIELSQAFKDGHCENALVDSFNCELTGPLTWDGSNIWVLYQHTLYCLQLSK